MNPGLLLVTRNGMPPSREDFSIIGTAVAGTCEHPGVMVMVMVMVMAIQHASSHS